MSPQLPAFCCAVILLFWSMPLVVLTGFTPLFSIRRKRRDGYDWGRFLSAAFGVRAYRVGSGQLCTEPCMYLCNHRSWADFFLDCYLTAGRSQFMSRMMVAIGFPFFMMGVYIMKHAIIFKRVTLADKEKFNKWIDQMLAESPVNGLLVYPEGHRSIRPDSLPLRRGMLRFAYTRGMLAQVLITANKEYVMSERKKCARYGQAVVSSYAPVVDPKQFDTFDAFMERVQETWDRHWQLVYHPEPGTEIYPNELNPMWYWYNLETHMKMNVCTAVSIVAFVGFNYVLLLIVKGLAWLVGTTAVAVLLGALLLTCVISSVVYSRPVPLNPAFKIVDAPPASNITNSTTRFIAPSGEIKAASEGSADLHRANHFAEGEVDKGMNGLANGHGPSSEQSGLASNHAPLKME